MISDGLMHSNLFVILMVSVTNWHLNQRDVFQKKIIENMRKILILICLFVRAFYDNVMIQ